MVYLLSLWGIMGMDFGSGASVVGLEKIFRPPCLAVAASNCWWHCAHVCHWAQFQHGWVFGGLFWVCRNIYKNNLGRVIASWLQIWQVNICIIWSYIAVLEIESTKPEINVCWNFFFVPSHWKREKSIDLQYKYTLIININIRKILSRPKRSGGVLLDHNE